MASFEIASSIETNIEKQTQETLLSEVYVTEIDKQVTTATMISAT